MAPLSSRRTFLRALVEGSLKGASIPLLARMVADGPSAWGADVTDRLKEVIFYEKLGDDYIQCGVCPNTCTLGDKGQGICRSRRNHGGVHYNHAYGNPCILSVDPLEKLPMNHFLPGTEVVCIAAGGCNLRCLYCQNYEWSQKSPDQIRNNFELGPGKAVHSVLTKEIPTIAFTYTDIVAYLEYACAIAEIARNSGLHCVAATNGFMNPKTARLAADKLSGITVGLKGFDEDFYRKVCGARLKPVLDTIVEIKSQGKCWLELTTLIVPTYNDDMKSLKAMARWIRKNVGPRVPWHLARFVPRYKLANVPRTSVETLDQAMDIGLDAGLEYVYTSNIAPHRGNNTLCPRCGKILIERVGFKILKNNMKDGKCKCGQRVPGFFDAVREK